MYFFVSEKAKGRKFQAEPVSGLCKLYSLLNVISGSEIKVRPLLKDMRLTQQAQRGLEVTELSHRTSRARVR